LTGFNYQLPVYDNKTEEKSFDQRYIGPCVVNTVCVEPLHESRLQRNRATTAAPAAIIAFQRCNVLLAMEIADLLNDDDVYNARSDAAAAAAFAFQ